MDEHEQNVGGIDDENFQFDDPTTYEETPPQFRTRAAFVCHGAESAETLADLVKSDFANIWMDAERKRRVGDGITEERFE